MSKKTYVSCKIKGGLGNQLFQVATTLSYAKNNQCTSIFKKTDEIPCVFTPRPVYWNSYFHKLNLTPDTIINKFKTYKEKQFSYSPLPTFNTDTLLDGYFQSAQYFESSKNLILDQLSLPKDQQDNIRARYSSLIKTPNKVAIHIRRGDYLKLKKYHSVLSETDYYERAISFFPQNEHFIIFSDDINWCKENIDKLTGSQRIGTNKKNWHFIQNDDVTELYLMSQCHHHIIANSTFSWWGAYMSPHGGKVIAPKNWFAKKTKVDSIKDIYLESWTII